MFHLHILPRFVVDELTIETWVYFLDSQLSCMDLDLHVCLCDQHHTVQMILVLQSSWLSASLVGPYQAFYP